MSLQNKLFVQFKRIYDELKEGNIVLSVDNVWDEYKRQNPRAAEHVHQKILKECINEFRGSADEDPDAVQEVKTPRSRPDTPPLLAKRKNDGSFNELEKIEKKNFLHYLNNGNQEKEQKDIQKTNLEMIDSIIPISQLGGIEITIQMIQRQIFVPIQGASIFKQINISPSKGVLITGPPGSGKTAIGLAICREIYEKFNYPFFFKNGTQFVSGLSGESEKNLRELFNQAQQNSPCIIFIDEIDTIAGSKEKASQDMERRIVSELGSCLDSLPDGVMVLAATSRPETLQMSIRRCGRFDSEVLIPVPTDKNRHEMLNFLTKKVSLSKEVKLEEIAQNTPGYVAADLSTLIRQAGVNAVHRIIKDYPEAIDCAKYKESLDTTKLIDDKNGIIVQESKRVCYEVTQADIEIALLQIQPTGKREGFASIPSVTWHDIGALDVLKQELEHNIILPIKEPWRFERMNIESPAGILLYGPPGCGKTLLAKAVANSSQANFIAVQGPELLNQYVGQSERSVRSVFARAQASAPCIIFFDELDALCPQRGTEGNQVTQRVVNALLAEMDGVEGRKQVYIIAATNRPDIIDPAMLRPGRLDQLLYVPLPNQEDRFSILKALVRKTPIEKGVNLESVAYDKKLEGFSGADMSFIVQEAGMSAILKNQHEITQENFTQAIDQTQKSISDEDIQQYLRLKANLRTSKHMVEQK